MINHYPTLIKAIGKINLLQKRRCLPILVSIDGGSGAGKSTLASVMANKLDAIIIPIDDFFSGNIPEDKWDKFTTKEKLENVFDWQRLRNFVLKPLLNSKPAKWQSLDFELGIQSDGTYKLKSEFTYRNPAKVILLEGAYSSSPKLIDLVDLSILIDVDIKKRYFQLELRESREFLEKWHQRWDDVEKYYYSRIRPKSSYDLILKFE